MNKKKQIRQNSPRLRKGIVISWGAGSIIAIAALVVVQILTTTKYNSILRQYFGEDPSTTVTNEASEGLDLNYYSSAYDSKAKLKSHEDDLCTQIGQEGAVLLKNDKSLPLAGGTKISFFSESSVDPVYGGAGSGGSSSADSISLKDAFTTAGFSVNTTLWDFYDTGAGSKYRRSHVTYYDGGEDWAINECPLSQMSSVLPSATGTTPVFVFARSAGEGRDLARNMYSWTKNSDDQKKHYLEPNSDELAILKYLNDNFSNVIVLANTDNVMEMGWIKDYPNIKSLIYMSGVGTTGFKGLANLFAGTASFSGKLADTMAFDDFSSPAMQNMGDYEWGNSGYYYVNYEEGIYVGYKYYETRYEDAVLGTGNAGDYAYDTTVQYPFGYGLSYTTFSYSDYSLVDNKDGTLTASVTVTNTGSVSGKESVEFYLSSPYTDYDIQNKVEKAAVDLVGFAKTGELASGAQEKVTVTLPLSDFKAYDYTTAKTYIMDAGDYYVTAAQNSHAAVNNILLAKKQDGKSVDEAKMSGDAGNAALVGKYTQAAFDGTTYAVDSITGTSVTNQFDFASLADSKYLTRNDWTGTFPAIYGTPSDKVSGYSERANKADGKGYTYTHDASAELIAKLDSKDSLNPNATSDVKARYGENNNLQLIDLRGASYDDSRWNDLIAEMSSNEIGTLIGVSGFRTAAADSISKPTCEDHDGPQGLNDIVSKAIIGYSFPTETLMAMTWNKDILKDVGACIGEDGLVHSIPGWYAPAMDIHRTPFAGRNFEYYSEDDYLSGTLGKVEIAGAAEKGMYAFVKHFALNDQENHRSGVSTWSNEQAIREVYLHAFELAMKNDPMDVSYYSVDEQGNYNLTTAKLNPARAVMTSMNRIGATWSGGNYALITKVLKQEWGFSGIIETDYTQTTDYMDPTQLIQAGGSCILSTVCPVYKISDSQYGYAREAVKGILYCVANSVAMNGLVHGTIVIRGFAHYRYITIPLEIVLGLIALAGLLVIAFELLRFFHKRQLITRHGGALKDSSLVYVTADPSIAKPTLEDFNNAYGKLYQADSEGIASLLKLYDLRGATAKAEKEAMVKRYLANPSCYDTALQTYQRLSIVNRFKVDKDAIDSMKMLASLIRRNVPDAYLVSRCPQSQNKQA
jgi:beta-glucosidase